MSTCETSPRVNKEFRQSGKLAGKDIKITSLTILLFLTSMSTQNCDLKVKMCCLTCRLTNIRNKLIDLGLSLADMSQKEPRI